jgi:hypothetical protein
MFMKEKETTKKLVPPYLPYKTLSNFLDSMKVAIPTRIDRSLMKSMAGTLQSQLMAALEYLKLITPTPDNKPTEKLTRLINSEGPERQRILKEILTSSYTFLFKDGFDLQRTTLSELQEYFTQAGVSGDTLRKSMAFFMKASKAAGLTISPHIKKDVGRPRGSTKEKRKMIPKPNGLPSDPKDPLGSQGQSISLEQMLLSKFPSFDPEWPDDVKTKWFEGFNKLMEQFKKE